MVRIFLKGKKYAVNWLAFQKNTMVSTSFKNGYFDSSTVQNTSFVNKSS